MPALVDGRKAWPIAATDPHGRQVYFKISEDAFKDGGYPSVVFTIDYYDRGTGIVTLQYDSLDDAPVPGAVKKAGAITLGNTKTWKTATFTVTDARFDERCNGSDFRLTFKKDVELILGAVGITPGTAPPSVAWKQTPRGKVVEGAFEQSRIYPGTTHRYSLYVPKQYDPAKPACIYVSQDGLSSKFTSALNKLIYNKQIPVMVAVGIHSGVLAAPNKESMSRNNRCYEYDSLGDEYARFSFGRNPAVRCQNARPEPVRQRQRPRNRRRFQRRHLRFQRRLAAPRRLPPRLLRQRQLRGLPRWRYFSRVHPPMRSQAATYFHACRQPTTWSTAAATGGWPIWRWSGH